MTAATKSSWFAPKLKSALESKNMSVRALARAWRPASDAETSRRSINRYLHGGIVPSQQVRGELAAAIGVETSSLERDDDDEESESMSLDEFLDRRVRQILRRERHRVGSDLG